VLSYCIVSVSLSLVSNQSTEMDVPGPLRRARTLMLLDAVPSTADRQLVDIDAAHDIQ